MMTAEEMTQASVEKIAGVSDDEMQAIWDRLLNGFFLADTAKKAELEAFSVDRQRAFLKEYAQELMRAQSYVEPFWRYVVQGESFAF